MSVNQDVRFYVDVANGVQTGHGWMCGFTMLPVDLAADGWVSVGHESQSVCLS